MCLVVLKAFLNAARLAVNSLGRELFLALYPSHGRSRWKPCRTSRFLDFKLFPTGTRHSLDEGKGGAGHGIAQAIEKCSAACLEPGFMAMDSSKWFAACKLPDPGALQTGRKVSECRTTQTWHMNSEQTFKNSCADSKFKSLLYTITCMLWSSCEH